MRQTQPMVILVVRNIGNRLIHIEGPHYRFRPKHLPPPLGLA
jgi:hypothetical protein